MIRTVDASMSALSRCAALRSFVVNQLRTDLTSTKPQIDPISIPWRVKPRCASSLIILTAEATEEAMQQCKAAGMKAFLTKPIDPEMLFETIGTLIGVGNEDSHEAGSDQLNDKTHLAMPAESVLDESVLAELAMHAHSSTFVTDVVDSVESDLRDLFQRFDTEDTSVKHDNRRHAQ